jgi:hypothetical protein
VKIILGSLNLFVLRSEDRQTKEGELADYFIQATTLFTLFNLQFNSKNIKLKAVLEFLNNLRGLGTE